MISVYVILGADNFRYIGITSNLKRRIKEHNFGKNKSTRNYAPFRIFHTELFPDYIEARKREKFLKSGAGRKFLDNLGL
ncbi:MAG: GIY-YIG nuclease family protein [Candidatus Jorgensenbacteria bacterium]|nr:GIY-YIG nuclease family protein [Candidatus Jorgensenbacteria bacterium]